MGGPYSTQGSEDKMYINFQKENLKGGNRLRHLLNMTILYIVAYRPVAKR
jgi:hypothetical protein